MSRDMISVHVQFSTIGLLSSGVVPVKYLGASHTLPFPLTLLSLPFPFLLSFSSPLLLFHFLPFPYPLAIFIPSFSNPPLSQIQLRGRWSAVSSPSGVRSGAPATNAPRGTIFQQRENGNGRVETRRESATPFLATLLPVCDTP